MPQLLKAIVLVIALVLAVLAVTPLPRRIELLSGAVIIGLIMQVLELTGV